MPTPRFLRRLDQRVLPPIGRALSGFSRGTRRLRVVMVIASVLSLAVVVLTVYVATRSPSTHTRPQGPTERVGVSAGQSIDGYQQQARERLNAQVASFMPKPGAGILALVTLTGYVNPPDVDGLVHGARVLQVFTHVYVDGEWTDVRSFATYEHLPSDLEDVAQHIALKAQDRDAAQRVVIGDSDDDRALRQMYAQQEALYRTEATAYASSKCACAFAMVVFGDPSQLAALAAADGVRAVDPVGSAGPLSNIVFAPPRPEEKDRADAQDGVVTPSDSGP
jgi:hypothetical protein